MMNRNENPELAKRLQSVAWVVSGAVLFLVMLMRRVKIPLPEGISFSFLPPLHAALNAGTAVVLLLALYFIKNKRVDAHRNAIYVAMSFSLLFLLSYVAYHFTTPETIFGDSDGNGVLSPDERLEVGGLRIFYLVLLLSHIALAAISLPFILFTFIRGFTFQVEKHRAMARWVFPVWFYVALTGPICYALLMPYYPQ